MRFDVIILAGGLGTRLASVVSDVPKPMAPVAGKPFLDYILAKLPLSAIHQIILAVGHKYEKIEEYYGTSYQGIPILYSIEHEPLGTGGGIAQAMKYCVSANCLILNGDTYFDVNFEELFEIHTRVSRPITLALKQVESPDRYGTVLLDGNAVVQFKEKQAGIKTGLINGGVYAVNQSLISFFPSSEKYSFETEVLEKLVSQQKIAGHISQGLFIDIGIPSDYERAQHIFAK
jgi:D-glycero-alpha-D-manno-heptose 1-phosphate guanylyltransferase